MQWKVLLSLGTDIMYPNISFKNLKYFNLTSKMTD